MLPEERRLLELSLAEDRLVTTLQNTLSDAEKIPRPHSAHEELVTNGRTWRAVCGWLDEISAPTADGKPRVPAAAGLRRPLNHASAGSGGLVGVLGRSFRNANQIVIRGSLIRLA